MSHPSAAPLDVLKQRDLTKRNGDAKRAARRPPRGMESLEPRRLFAAGDLDPTFAGDGVLTSDAFGAHARAWDVAVQGNGKVIVAGAVSSPSGLTSDAALIRYNADGSLDASFGNGGVARLDYGGFEHFRELRILEGGKIVVGGVSKNNGSVWVLARYKADGTLDAGSGFGGTDGVAMGGGTLDGMTLDHAGRIVTFSNSEGVRRHSGSTGALDATFGRNGWASAQDVGNPLALDVDEQNRILISGRENINDPETEVDRAYATAARLTTAGTLDPTFGDDGIARLAGSTVHEGVDIVWSNGYVLVLCNSTESGSDVYRLSDSGRRDTSFSQDGIHRVGFLKEISPSFDDVPTELIVDAVGLYVVGYADDNSGGTKVGIQRLTDLGDDDTRFGTGGKILFPLQGGSSSSPVLDAVDMAAAFSPGGRLVIAGNAIDYPQRHVAVARLEDVKAEPAATVPQISIQGGVLVARGTIFADAFYVHRTGADRVTIDIQSDSGAAATGSFDMDDFTGVRLEGLAGHDTFDLIDALVSPVVRNTTVLGGSGDDTTSYATRTADLKFSVQLPASRMTSGAQTDVLDHVETIIGGSGNDTFAYGDNPSLPEEEENSTISYRLEGRGGNDRFVTSWMSHDNVKAVTLYGGDGADRFEQGDLGGRVFGEGGDDTIVMIRESYYDGWIDGGTGTDLAIWGSMIGRPVLDLRDYVSVENANVLGSRSGRTIIGTDAANHIDTTGGTDEVNIQGLGGNDTLIGGDANESLDGGAGDDSIVGGSGDDTLDGGAGTDTLRGDTGTDTLLDGEVTDAALPGVTLANGVLSFVGTHADESVSIWRDGASLVVWLDGVTATYDYASVTRIELSGGVGNDYLKLHQALNIPALLIGGFGDDRLIGGSNKDTLLGGEGNDHLTGNNGDDHFDGGLGSDVARGSAGRDTLDYSSRVNRLIVGLDGFRDDGEAGENDFACDDIERLIGGGANDKLGGGRGILDQSIYGGPGNDTIYGGGGKDALFGEAGNDRLGGGDGDDYLEGGAGHDALYGDGGGDTLLGLGGNDQLFSFGDGRTDSVNGGAGSDSADFDDLIDVVVDSVTGVETFI